MAVLAGVAVPVEAEVPAEVAVPVEAEVLEEMFHLCRWAIPARQRRNAIRDSVSTAYVAITRAQERASLAPAPKKVLEATAIADPSRRRPIQTTNACGANVMVAAFAK